LLGELIDQAEDSSVLRWFPHHKLGVSQQNLEKMIPQLFQNQFSRSQKQFSQAHLNILNKDYGKSATPLETIFEANYPHGKITIPCGFSEHRSSNAGMLRKFRLSPWHLEPQPHPGAQRHWWNRSA
jgi:hypothetical protein